jgi:proline-specific peptidase
LADTGRRVIYYDQLGCGRSHIDQSKPEMWTVELFVEEVDVIRRALGLEQIHLLGQSWGGMLAMEYMFTQPKEVASVTIVSSPASMIQWVEEANRLREQLPPEVQAALLKHEAAGTTDSKEYLDAMQVFYDRHVCRVVPNPDYVQRSFNYIAQYPEVYNTMNGPSEFHVVGTLKNWDVRHRLGEIHAPTLVTSGRYDEATPLIAETVHKGIAGSKWVVFENSSHLAHVEETDLFMKVVTEFISQYDS